MFSHTCTKAKVSEWLLLSGVTGAVVAEWCSNCMTNLKLYGYRLLPAFRATSTFKILLRGFHLNIYIFAFSISFSFLLSPPKPLTSICKSLFILKRLLS